MSIRKMRAASNGVIATSLEVPVGYTYRLISVSCVFAIAPTTSESFTLELDAIGGSQYDVQLHSFNPATSATTDIFWQPAEELFLIGGDVIDAAFTGTDGYNWAIEWTVKAVP